MKAHQILGLVCFSYAIIGASVCRSATFEVKGTVTDKALGTGIPGVTVILRKVPGAGSQLVHTFPDGTYVITGVGSGNYNLEVSAGGYTPTVKLPLFVSGNCTAQAVELMVNDGDLAYYDEYAARIANLATSAAPGQRAQILTDGWLACSDLPPKSKVYLALAFTNRDAVSPSLKPSITGYAAADRTTILAAQNLFGDAITRAASVPGQDHPVIGQLNEHVIADIAAYQLKNVGVSEAQKTAFLFQFKLKWAGTNANALLTQKMSSPAKVNASPR